MPLSRLLALLLLDELLASVLTTHHHPQDEGANETIQNENQPELFHQCKGEHLVLQQERTGTVNTPLITDRPRM